MALTMLRSVRVLIVSQYFAPEVNAAAPRVRAFAAGLARRGHDVEVVCEAPSHPAGVIAPGYSGGFRERRQMDGYPVNYTWVWVSPSKTTGARLLNYASWPLTGTLVGSTRRRPDVLLASSPPLPVGAVGALLATRHRAPWVLDVRDLWPDAAVIVDQVGEGHLVRAARWLERRLYQSAGAITTTTEAFAAEISKRGGRDKVTLLRNGASEAALKVGAEPPDSAALDGDGFGGFRWTYAGNLGLAQGLETAVEAARELGDGFKLLLVGDGPRATALRELASERAPGLVSVRPSVPHYEAMRLMRASDALLVPLARTSGLEAFVPSKLFDCCAVARPVILAAAGEASRLAGRAGAALCVEPGDPQALAAAVRSLRDDPALRTRMEASARAFGEENSRESGVDRLERLLTEVCAGK